MERTISFTLNGEPPIVTMDAVIAIAVYDATGARLLQLPMTTVRVLEARKVLQAGTVLKAFQGF